MKNGLRTIGALIVIAAIAAGAGAGSTLAAAEKPLLAQRPSISQTQLVFAYAGDLWIAPRDGGAAIHLTTGVGVESDPVFSPDGATVAFTGQYDGNTDVFVVPAAGGVPRRITYHPGPDEVTGWTPDGKRIVFRSGRQSSSRLPPLFTVSVEGGFPEALPLPTAVSGSFSADGTRLAYVPTMQWQAAWKRYQGGQTTPIWIVSLADLKVEKIPRENSNDSDPMWVGDKIYFLSDRAGPVSLFCYDTKSKAVTQVVKSSGLDLKAASAGPGAIVYEQFGAIHLVDVASGKDERVPIRVSGDLPEVRPGF